MKKIVFFTITAILCIGTTVTLFTFFRSPKKTVMQAITHTLTNVNTTAPDYLHTNDFGAMFADGHYQTTCNLALEDYDDSTIENTDYEGFIALAPSVSMISRVDYPNKKAHSTLDFICGGSSLLKLNAYAMDDTLGIECPALYDGCLSFNTTTLAKDYNSSSLCTLLGNRMLDRNINVDLFSTKYSDKSFGALYAECYAADTKALYEAMTVKKVKGDTIQIGKQSVSLKGYEIKIPRAQIEKTIDNILSLSVHQSEPAYLELRYQLEQTLGIVTLPEKFICTVYVDPKTNSMLKCVHVSDYQVDNISTMVDFSIEWLGEKYPSDNITSTITLNDAKNCKKSINCDITTHTKETIYEKSLALSMNTTGKPANDETLAGTLNYSIDTSNGALIFQSNVNRDKNAFMTLDITGSFFNIKPKKCISLDIDHASFTTSYHSTSLSLTGDYTFESLQSEVTTPTETLRPVFEMSEDDFYGFIYEVLRNFSDSTLGSFLYQ